MYRLPLFEMPGLCREPTPRRYRPGLCLAFRHLVKVGRCMGRNNEGESVAPCRKSCTQGKKKAPTALEFPPLWSAIHKLCKNRPNVMTLNRTGSTLVEVGCETQIPARKGFHRKLDHRQSRLAEAQYECRGFLQLRPSTVVRSISLRECCRWSC